MVLGLAAVAFGVIAAVFKAPRRSWEAVAAALVLGIAGFALQASPSQPGAPKAEAAPSPESGAALVAVRQQLAGPGDQAPNRWMVIADAMARNGQFGDAAGVVLGAVEADPGNANAWLALGNDLLAHADGALTPAAQFAYRRAAAAAPDHPGPPFFLGLALATNGRLAEGRAVWADLLARAPRDAPWRRDLELRLARLDAFIAARQAPPSAR